MSRPESTHARTERISRGSVPQHRPLPGRVQDWPRSENVQVLWAGIWLCSRASAERQILLRGLYRRAYSCYSTVPASPSTARASRDQPLRPARSGRRQQQHDQVRRQRRAIGLGAAAIALALGVLIAARALAPSANAPEGPVPPDVLAGIANVTP